MRRKAKPTGTLRSFLDGVRKTISEIDTEFDVLMLEGARLTGQLYAQLMDEARDTYTAVNQIQRDAGEAIDYHKAGLEKEIFRLRAAEHAAFESLTDKVPSIRSWKHYDKLADIAASKLGICTLFELRKSVVGIGLIGMVAAKMHNLPIFDTIASHVFELGTSFYPALSQSDSQALTTAMIGISALSAYRLFSVNLAGRRAANFDQNKYTLERWQSKLQGGWANWAVSVIGWVNDKLHNSLPPFEKQTLQQLKSLKQGELARLFTTDLLTQPQQYAFQSIVRELTQQYRIGMADTVAIEMLLQEPDPNRVMAILRSREIPEHWAQEFKIERRFLVSTDRNWSLPLFDHDQPSRVSQACSCQHERTVDNHEPPGPNI
ncbi:hypothetical protein ACI2KR_29185 [Pseudomonas luteola]